MDVKLAIKITIAVFIFVFVVLIQYRVLALNPDEYCPEELTYSEGERLYKKAEPIIKLITNIGIIGSILALTIIGLKYMLGSTLEEKAKIKEMILPLICGCLLITGVFTLVKLIASIAPYESSYSEPIPDHIPGGKLGGGETYTPY